MAPPIPKHDERFVIGPCRLGKLYGRSRWWGSRLLREWWAEQLKGAPIRVFRRPSGRLYTTLGIIDQHMPRRRDEVLERRLRTLERDLSESFARIAELERAIGRRR
jgi:hypothetical protein